MQSKLAPPARIRYRMDYHQDGIIPLPTSPALADTDPRYGPWLDAPRRYVYLPRTAPRPAPPGPADPARRRSRPDPGRLLRQSRGR